VLPALPAPQLLQITTLKAGVAEKKDAIAKLAEEIPAELVNSGGFWMVFLCLKIGDTSSIMKLPSSESFF